MPGPQHPVPTDLDEHDAFEIRIELQMRGVFGQGQYDARAEPRRCSFTIAVGPAGSTGT